jgi:hypothetical protein
LSGSRRTSVCVSFKAVPIGFTWFRLDLRNPSRL